MKNHFAFICVLLLLAANTMAQKIVSYQYWFDNNFAGAVTTSTTADTVVTVNAAISAASLTQGLHTFSVRFLDSNGNYSVPLTSEFENSDGNIVSYEYWFDYNYSTVTSVSVTPGQVVNINAALSTGAVLTPGIHYYSLRTKDSNGNYSVPVTTMFVKTGFNLVEYEYWFDGNFTDKTDVAISPTQQYSFATINASALTNGTHIIALHVKDQFGSWSVPVVDTFSVVPLGIKNLSLIEDVSVFPNPTSDMISVTVSTSAPEDFIIRMVDMKGTIMNAKAVKELNGGYTYSYDISKWAAGNYFCIIDDGKNSFVKKYVKE